MKKKMVFALVCVLLLVVATFVACNDTQSDEVVKKPIAPPDPNNEYDAKCTEDHSYSDSLAMEHDKVAIWIDITNTESINNLFYDYKSTDFINEEVFITEKNDDVLSMLREKVKNNEFDVETKLRLSQFCRRLVMVIADKGSIDVMGCLRQIRQRDDVRCASLTPSGPAGWFDTTPNDYSEDAQWALKQISAPQAWDHTTGTSAVKVGVIDTGINANHPDLIGNVDTELGRNSQQGSFLADSEGHGTMVAGVIGAVGNNGKGISGVCWDVDLVSLRADGSNGKEDVDEVIKSIEYAQTNNIRILNFSGGFYNTDITNTQRDNLKNALEAYGGLLICAAGNDGKELTNQLYPQTFGLENVIVVGSSTAGDVPASDSNYGSKCVNLFAPGVNIKTTTNSGGYAYPSGTSVAAPFVAGVAALLFSRCPTLTPADVKASILTNLDKVSGVIGKCSSNGRLNAEKALKNFIHPSCAHRVNFGITVGHAYACDHCDYHADIEPHRWIPHKIGGVKNGYDCAVCGAYTQNIEIIHPYLAPDIQNQITAMTLSGTKYATIEIDEHTAIVYDNGRIYLMVECDEFGNIVSAVPDEIFAKGYSLDRIIAEQQVE